MTFVAEFIGRTGDICSYRIQQGSEGKLVRTFAGRVPCSQRASAKGWGKDSDKRKVDFVLNRNEIRGMKQNPQSNH